MTFGRGILSFLLSLLLLQAQAATAADQAVAAQGRLQIPAAPRAPVSLEGQWGFAWQQFVDPHWTRLPTEAFAPVPSSWNEVSAGGKPAGVENGWGSYVLQVDCPRGESLAVEAVGQRTASRLFVNGTEVAAHGEPGRTADETWAAVHNRIPITREFACPLRLTLHIANFDHRAGGFVRPLAVGPADLLTQHRESRVIYDAALLTAYLFTGLVALIFYGVRRRERVPLVFGLFCVAMAVYTDMIGERLLLRPLPPLVSWIAYMRVEYLSWLAAMALFFLTLRGLFPAEIHKRAVQGIVGALGLAAIAVVALPPGVYSHLAVPGQSVAVLVTLYVAAAMIRARKRSPIDAWVLLAGMLAILATLAIDLLLIDAPRPDSKFAPFGFALFLLSPAAVIARRLSHALNAEERSRTLEENARLREDVERMSRHDLKTPLNSILGVSRLLGDDTRLNAEQRELVGMLQRAGFRMLELVNLSLGLFKMETGSYDFRPQAVDLREVVTRVLVDLHSYADANAVTLHLQGPDPAPLYVRAEELLCYSIIANLVKNAVEATDAGEQVDITLLRGEPVVLTVRNPGEVPPHIAKRFFEKYVTGGKSGGTGLGTYSALLMARAQQGDLQLQTGAGGTTLALALRPLKDEALLPLPKRLAERSPAQWVSDMPARELLLVDDDEYTRLVHRRFLPTPPFSVDAAANGQAAIEAMARRWPHYLLVDMEMPVRNGIDTVRWVREHEAAEGLPRCHVVMLSGNDDPAAIATALRAGADRFLTKPVSRETLLSTLRELEFGVAAPPSESLGGEELPAQKVPDLPATPDDEVVTVDPEWMEFFPGFVRLQQETVEGMAHALASGDRDGVHFLAHRASGGLGSMGLHWASRQSRIVELDAHGATTEALSERIAALRDHLKKVRIAPGLADDAV